MNTPIELRFTLAQINPSVGDISANFKKICDVWEKFDKSTDLIIFPELALTGYPPQDILHHEEFLEDVRSTIFHLTELSKTRHASILVGAPHSDKSQLFNSGFVISQGEIRHRCDKQKLPNYGVFDEKRYFTEALPSHIFEFNGVKLGILICEDFWFSGPALSLKNQGADILIGMHASPFEKGKIINRHNLAMERFSETKLPIIYVNQVGGQDHLVFDGHSFVVGASGHVTNWLDGFTEDYITLTYNKLDFVTERTELDRQVNHNTILTQSPESLAFRAACLAIRDYLKKTGQKKILIGLSGGVDSALAAAMAVEAVGAHNVHAIMMPSKFTSQQSLDDAAKCANGMGITYEIVPIKEIMESFMVLQPQTSGLALENLQSRLRGVILMTRSNMTGAMVLTTGNKSEMATGYTTLYGDMCGGFNPLRDLYKTEVYRICNWLNTAMPLVIPQSIIDRPPSAELRDNQCDQDSLPPYPLLDHILEQLIEQDRGVEHIVADGYDRLIVEKVSRLLILSEYKRSQSAVGPKLSCRDLKFERRYPIANGYQS